MRDCVGYEGRYAVTSCGKVWSYRSNRFLTIGDFNGNYQMVSLVDADGKVHNEYVHRLVAKAYIPNPDSKLFTDVNHLDEVKNHNWVGNLEWCTREYNINYGTGNDRRGRKPVYCPELNKTFPSIRRAAKLLGINSADVWGVANGRIKQAKGFTFQYAK